LRFRPRIDTRISFSPLSIHFNLRLARSLFELRQVYQVSYKTCYMEQFIIYTYTHLHTHTRTHECIKRFRCLTSEVFLRMSFNKRRVSVQTIKVLLKQNLCCTRFEPRSVTQICRFSSFDKTTATVSATTIENFSYTLVGGDTTGQK
jgi:hypothetical protein